MSDPATLMLGGLCRMPSPQALALRALRLIADTKLYSGLEAILSARDAALAISSGVIANGSIADTINIKDVPGKRRVTLFDHRTLRPVAQTWSDPVTGVYCFDNLIPGRAYLVICDDYQQIYNAAIADWVFPEVD